MKNKIEDLRNHLFETIEALKDKDEPMDLSRAKAICEVGHTIIDLAKVELHAMDLLGVPKDVRFFNQPMLPVPAARG